MTPKKFSIYRLIDELFWLLVVLLPLIFYVIYSIHAVNPIPFLDYISQNLSLNLNTESIIFSTINEIFTNGFGYFDLFTNMGFAIHFFVWFFFVEFMHVFLDIVLFIPRYCHELMYSFCYEKRL